MTEHIKSYWTDAHKKYAERGHVAKPTLFVEEVLQYLPNRGTLLELGAGQGQDSRFFAREGFTVTSTDLTPHALNVSRQLAEKEGLDISFQEIDIATTLPFEDETFDVVYAHMALHYFGRETTERIFSEISRVLKPAGMFAALLNTVDDPETERDDFEEIEKDFYKTPAGIYKRFFSADTLKAFTQDYFKPIMLDNNGRTYKDEIETLIRFVGRKK